MRVWMHSKSRSSISQLHKFECLGKKGLLSWFDLQHIQIGCSSGLQKHLMSCVHLTVLA